MNRAAPAQICQTMDPNGLKQVPKLFKDGPHGGTGRTDGTDGTDGRDGRTDGRDGRTDGRTM